MNEIGFWPRFAVAVFATWRISHLLAREDGPGDVLARLHARAGSGFFGELLVCFHCLSLWVAAPLAFFVAERPLDLLFVWLALSGAACLLERVGQQPVVIQPTPPELDSYTRAESPQVAEGDRNDGMLRAEASGAPDHTPQTTTSGRQSSVS